MVPKRVSGNVHRANLSVVMQAEMVTFLSGRCIFHPENGDPVEIKGGDVLFFPENSKGTWEIIETVRKAYLIYNIK